jgi:integrase/recombinase XerD
LKDGHSDDGPIFWGRLGKPLDVPGFQGIVKRAFAKAGIMGRRASPHTLRHTYSTHYLNQGGDLKSLKEILGHSDIKTTEGYTRLTKQDLIVKNARYNPLCHIPQGHPNISPTGASLSPVDENITW